MEAKRLTLEMVGAHVRRDTVLLPCSVTIENAIHLIRASRIADQITYFYVVNEEQVLLGVLPIRRLLSAAPQQRVAEVMVHNVQTLLEQDSLAKAQKLFNQHKYLAFPVVDTQGRMRGVIDVTVITGKDLTFKENQRFDDIFETIGVRASVLHYLTPVSAFRHRFPWLVPTLAGGLSCAILVSFFEHTLAQSIVLAYFLTLILGLGESISIQTLTITIRRLHIRKPTWDWYVNAAAREFLASLLLGLAMALILVVVILIWKRDLPTAVSVGISVVASLCTASFIGLTVPTVLHKTRLDPKVAAGPLVLGLADLFTLLFYFLTASSILRIE